MVRAIVQALHHVLCLVGVHVDIAQLAVIIFNAQGSVWCMLSQNISYFLGVAQPTKDTKDTCNFWHISIFPSFSSHPPTQVENLLHTYSAVSLHAQSALFCTTHSYLCHPHDVDVCTI